MRFGPVLLGYTDGDVWRPGIGDPTVMGWLTVVAYFWVAALCLRKALVARGLAGARSLFLFWGLTAGILVLLGINKQLDLQTWLTLTGRRIAISQGWYDSRRVVQLIFFVLVALMGVASCWAMWRLVRTHGREMWLPLAGILILLCFVLMRAASFHHVDQLINFRFAGVRMNWVLELGSIAILGWGARKRNAVNPRLEAERRILAA